MNNEIKEILNNLRYTAKKHTIQVLEDGRKIEHCPQEIATEIRLNTYSANILLDYITNLQEELEKLNNEIKILKQNNVNEILRDDLVLCTKQYKKSEEKLEKANKKIDKTIEYIQNHQLVFQLSTMEQIVSWFDEFYKDTLNILRGENK